MYFLGAILLCVIILSGIPGDLIEKWLKFLFTKKNNYALMNN